MSKSDKVCVSIVGACLVMMTVPAANARDGDDPVLTRNPYDEATPSWVGPFAVTTSATAGIEYDGNVFFEADDEQDDQIVWTGARATAVYDAERFKSALRAGLSNRTYLDNSDLSTTNFDVQADNDYWISDIDIIGFDVDRAYLTESRTDINSPDNSRDPVEYTVQGYEVSYTRDARPFALRTAVSHRRTDFEDVEAEDGTEIDQDFRDNERTSGEARLTWFRPENIELSIEASIDYYAFDFDPLRANPIDRDNNSTSLLFGVRTGNDRIVSLDARAGWQKVNYDDPTLEDEDSFRLDAQAVYRPTRLTDVTFSASRDRQPATLSGFAGVDVTSFDVQVDHELRPNLIVSAAAGQEYFDFSDSEREDVGQFATISANYFINPKLRASFEANIRTRETDFDDPAQGTIDRTRPRFGFQLTFTP